MKESLVQFANVERKGTELQIAIDVIGHLQHIYINKF